MHDGRSRNGGMRAMGGGMTVHCICSVLVLGEDLSNSVRWS
jgi:hypothetical protein